ANLDGVGKVNLPLTKEAYILFAGGDFLPKASAANVSPACLGLPTYKKGTNKLTTERRGRTNTVTNAFIQSDCLPIRDVPPVNPGLNAITRRLLFSFVLNAANDCVVSKLQSLVDAYNRIPLGLCSFGFARFLGCRLLGPKGTISGSWVSLVVMTIRPSSSISGHNNLANR